jgi:hypothetical protein
MQWQGEKILQTIQIDQLVSDIKTVFLFFENISWSIWGVLKTYPFQEISKFFVKKIFFDDDHHIKIISFDKTSKELNPVVNATKRFANKLECLLLKQIS